MLAKANTEVEIEMKEVKEVVEEQDEPVIRMTERIEEFATDEEDEIEERMPPK